MFLEKHKHKLAYQQGVAYSLDPALLPEGSSPELANLVLHKGVVKRAPGYRYHPESLTPLGTNPDVPILHIAPYYKDEVFQYHLIFTANNLFKLTNTAYESLANTVTYNNNESITTTRWLNKTFIATLAMDVGYWEEGKTSVTIPTDLTGVKARAVLNHYSHLILGYTYRDWETDRKSTRLNSSH